MRLKLNFKWYSKISFKKKVDKNHIVVNRYIKDIESNNHF